MMKSALLKSIVNGYIVQQKHKNEKTTQINIMLRINKLSLKWHLLFLVLGVTIPFLIFSGITISKIVGNERDKSKQQLQLGAKELAESVDQELSITIRSLETLAQSEYLDSGDLEKFFAYLIRIRGANPGWNSIILIDPNENIVFKTSSEEGGYHLNKIVEIESLRHILKTKKPTVGTLAKGPEGVFAVPVRVPVIRKNKIKYVLTAVLPFDLFQKIVRNPKTAENLEWTRTLIDSNGSIVARSRTPDLFIGASSSPEFLSKIKSRDSSFIKRITIDNKKVYVAFQNSPVFGWTAAIAVPREVLNLSAQKSLSNGLLMGGVLLLILGITTVWFSKRIVTGLSEVAKASRDLTQGKITDVKPSSVLEVDELRLSLQKSQALLKERDEERNRNLTKAHLAKAEAEASSDAKDRFLAMLGHELRNPVGVLSNGLHLLNNFFPENEEALEVKTIVDRQMNHLTQILDDLLDASRVAKGKVELKLCNIELGLLVKNIARDFQSKFKVKDVVLKVELPKESVWVYGDEVRLTQCLSNLLHNSLKFSLTGYSVVLRLEVRDQKAIVAVEDCGPGIDKSIQNTLFEPFVQGDQSLDRGQGGLGLGLAVVKSLVEAHRGKVYVDNKTVGTGAVFRFEIPTIEVESKLSSKKEIVKPSKVVEKKVLLIEDNLDAALTMRIMIEHLGHEVKVCHSAMDAMELIDSFIPDIILSDIGLPQMNGYVLCKKLKSHSNATNARFVAVSGYGSPDDIRKSFEAGFERHITKPCRIEDLENIFREFDGV